MLKIFNDNGNKVMDKKMFYLLEKYLDSYFEMEKSSKMANNDLNESVKRKKLIREEILIYLTNKEGDAK